MFVNRTRQVLDLLRIQHTLVQRGKRLVVRWRLGHRDWALYFLVVEKGERPCPRWKEEMARDAYQCQECHRTVYVEYPERRGEPVFPLPMGWVRVGKKTYCQYCVSSYGSKDAQIREERG